MHTINILFAALATLTLVGIWLKTAFLYRFYNGLGMGQAEISRWILLLQIALVGTVASVVSAGLAGNLYFSSLTQALLLLDGKMGGDSWAPMASASQWLAQHPGDSVYRELFYGGGVKFQYPTTSLLMLDVPRWVFGTDLETNLVFWQWASRISLLLIACIVMALMASSRDTPEVERSKPLLFIGRFLVALAFTLACYPLVRAEMLGQVQTLLTLGLVSALLAWRLKCPAIAGGLLGLCCLLKPHWALFLVWGALRRQWSFVIACGLVGAVGLALSIWIYGWVNFTDYVSVLGHLARHGESFYANQSINGLLHRWFENGPNLVWESNSFPPYHAVVHMVTTTTSAVIIAFALWWRWREPAQEMEFAFFAAALTIASPIAWEHHYSVLLAVIPVVAARLVVIGQKANVAVFLILAAFGIGNHFPLFNKLAESPYNFLQSWMLFSMILMLGFIAWLMQFSAVARGSDLQRYPPPRLSSK